MKDTSKATILIHGFGFDHRIWYPVELAFEGQHVIYLSLPGFGVEALSESYSITDLATKYWRHINAVVSGPVHLVGHSMGGYVCMEMLAQQPGSVASIALIHSHVFEDPAEKKEARSQTMKEINESGREAYVKKLIPSLFADDQNYSAIISKLVGRGLAYGDNAWSFGVKAMRDRKDHGATLSKSNVQVLMLMGEQDKAVPPEIAYKQASLSDRSVLHMYPGVGHMAMYENTPGMIEDLIRFYDGLPA